MEKPNSLRAAVAAVLPEIARTPDKLKIWVDLGRVRATQTPSRDFAIETTVTLELVDFAQHPSLVFLAINDWLRVNQPDLLAARREGYPFEVVPISNDAVDLTVTLKLSEAVRLTPRQGGGWNLEHLAEPVLFPDELPIADPPSLLRQIYWKDELLVE